MPGRSNFPRNIAVINAVGTASVILVNILANALPINGITTGELSDQYPNLFVPAGITFSIWGLIYLLLILWTTFQFSLAASSRSEQVSITSPWYFISCTANILWIIAWHYQQVLLSLLIMLVLLWSLVKLYLALGVGEAGALRRERLLYHLPVSVYLGWISVATIANVTAVLVRYDWGGFGLGDPFWTVAVILVGTLLGLAFLLKKRDIIHPLVVVWAYLGIIIKRTADAETVVSVIAAASAAAAVLTVLILVFAVTGRSYLTRRDN